MEDKAAVAQGSSLIPTSSEEAGATSSQKGELDQLLVCTLFPSQATRCSSFFFISSNLLWPPVPGLLPNVSSCVSGSGDSLGSLCVMGGYHEQVIF